MSGLIPPGPLTYTGQVVVPYINRTFPPSSDFNEFTVPTVWTDTAAEASYLLVSNKYVAGVKTANWIRISDGVSSYPITPYVVGPAGDAGYQTIQAGINAANAGGGGMVYLQPGTYTENLTFYDNVNLVSVIYENSGDVVITGTHTPPDSGSISIRGAKLIGTNAIFSSVAAGSTDISFEECTFQVTDGWMCDLLNWTGTINVNDAGSTGTQDGVFRNTGGGSLFTNNCQVGAGTTRSLTANGNVRLDLTFLNCPANISSGTLFVNFGLFAQTLTLSGNVSGTIFLGDFFTGASPAITMSSSGNIIVRKCSIDSSNNPAVTGAGAGTITFTDVNFVTNGNLAGTLTTGNSTFYPVKMTNGQLLIGSSNAAAVPASLTSSGGTITITPGAGTLNIDLTGGTVAVDSIAVQATTAPGVSPVVPTAAGLVTINGTAVAAQTIPIQSRSIAANTLQIEAQRASTSASTNSTQQGLASFDSTSFTVDANGWVQLAGGGIAIDSLQPDSGTNPVVPNGSGLVVMAGSGSITTVGSLNTITHQLTGLTNHSVLVGAGTATITKLAVGTNGQVLLGSTGADPAFGTLTSTGATITYTTGAAALNLDVASSVANSFVTDSGTATPSAHVLNIVSGLSTVNCGASVQFTGATNTVTLNVTDVTNKNTLIGLQAGNATLVSGGTSHIAIGYQSMRLASGGSDNIGIGTGTLSNNNFGGSNNICLGSNSGAAIFNGSNNITIGVNALQHTNTSNNTVVGHEAMIWGTGSNNTGLGYHVLSTFGFTGASNTTVGFNAGTNYVGAESSNILLSHSGTAAENNTIHIGTQGTGSGQQNKCYIAGIAGAAPANSTLVVIEPSTGQLGNVTLTNGQLAIGSTGAAPVAANLTAGTGITISNAAGSITINSTGSGMATVVVAGTTQAMAANTRYVSNNAGLVTLTLPVTAAVGDAFIVSGLGAGGWTIAQNASQTINVGSTATTVGVGGSTASTNRYDSISFVCVVANTTFITESIIGNLTVV